MKSFKAKYLGLVKCRSCFGCFGKDTVITEVDDPSKNGEVPGGGTKRSTISDSWDTSGDEIDDSGFESLPSISNQRRDPSGSTSNPSKFVNQGLLLWNQTRQQWLATSKRSEKQTELQEPIISPNATYDNLLENNEPFPRPIPLPEMVNFVVGVWKKKQDLFD